MRSASRSLCAYNATSAAVSELTTVSIPVLRGNGIDGLTVSVRRRLGAP